MLNDYYRNWTESDLRDGIWMLSNGMSIRGPFTDIQLLRAELRSRGLSDVGYHEGV